MLDGLEDIAKIISKKRIIFRIGVLL